MRDAPQATRELVARLLEAEDAGDGATDVEALSALIDGIAAAPERLGGHDGLALLPADDAAMSARLASLLRERAQRFEAIVEDPAASADRLARLRVELADRELDGFLVPLSDEYHGEWVPPGAMRLTWLTGFTGSAGLAIVHRDTAAIFVDGRYTLQVRQQVDAALFTPRHVSDEPPEAWIAETVQAGEVIGFDPWLHTESGLARIRAAIEKRGATLKATDGNPIDAVWTDRPPAPLSPARPLPLAYSGRESADKRTEVAGALDGADAVVLTLPDSIAWLLNIRGADVPHTPLPLSFAILHADATAELFIDPRKVDDELRRHCGNAVTISQPDRFGPALDALAGRKVRVDPASTGVWVLERLRRAGAQPVLADDPCQLPKACKNPTELDGARAAHRRDGIAVSRFLAWLAANGADGTIDEMSAQERLRAFRAEGELIRDLSFGTISGAGPNGAIVHYHATRASNRTLEPGSLYLVDSGGQYLDGTTDITRTVAIGTPSAEMKDRFTRVLKGHIALATARFPAGTTGSQLDALARQPLWQAGLDYDHGTGHGVGSYLGVHEGPQRISKIGNTVALRPGMIVSNEPGYYKTGAYGIRIENLVAVIECGVPEGGERPLLGFETLTLAPIDRNLVDTALLDDGERRWLDAYHARVRENAAPALSGEALAWLEAATAPLG
ncbi:aminopeptidase P family protein [Oceanibacterium hippocampi]|uniref:Xaa-Pro dipeptidase n=1 Tax=Oceanibacterium hippocampi TaxID=745714 RepID=A0A1Y5SCV4_9PROT|nr:aminopeptidase P family protein [Oceanibacterium hippocampi]SLN37497.1 Xaa-Pro dipeptidase [Oceanibacterium hippocampi]